MTPSVDFYKKECYYLEKAPQNYSKSGQLSKRGAYNENTSRVP